MGKHSLKRILPNRYAAKLLFQFRVQTGKGSGKLRLCEERIIVFTSVDAKAALKEARKRAFSSEHDYSNNNGNKVYFEFVGVINLLCLGPECDPDEVWYDISKRLLPMERKKQFLPSETELNAIRQGC